MPDAQDTQDPQYAQTLQWARDQLASLQAQPKIDTTGSPADGTRPSWTGLLGDVLSGGQGPGYQLRGQEADTAGNRALLNFGINMLLASGPQRVKPDLLSAAATGLQGAQQSLDVDQRRGALAAGAQQEYAQKQQEMQIARIKEAVPLLTLLQQSQSADAARRLAGSGATPPAAGVHRGADRRHHGGWSWLGERFHANGVWRQGHVLRSVSASRATPGRDAATLRTDRLADAQRGSAEPICGV
jgi:hypothetical protein